MSFVVKEVPANRLTWNYSPPSKKISKSKQRDCASRTRKIARTIRGKNKKRPNPLTTNYDTRSKTPTFTSPLPTSHRLAGSRIRRGNRLIAEFASSRSSFFGDGVSSLDVADSSRGRLFFPSGDRGGNALLEVVKW